MEHHQTLSMNQITAVTTFDRSGLELYAQRFLNSFADHVDKRIKMIVYAEDCVPHNPDPQQITVFDQKQSLPSLIAFKQRWQDVDWANGSCPWPERRPADHYKRFKWDAVRFSNKVYAVFDACKHCRDWAVWMDADTYVHSNWSYEDFNNLLPVTSWITYVGRGRGSSTWPECGFYGLNLNDPVCLEFLNEFEHMYENAENGIFTLDEWHDSYVFGHILNRMKKTAPNVLDYTARAYLQTAKTGGGGHPLINTELGRWIDHLKGERKSLGKSKVTDISTKRNESYWSNR
jgi:hypothetical protein